MVKKNFPNCLSLQATAILQAASDGRRRPTFSMVAYTGGLMTIEGFDELVAVSFAGLKIPSQTIPIRLQHNPDQGIGHTENVLVESGELIADGVISRNNQWAKDVADSGAEGYPWQASISTSIEAVEFIDARQTTKVNGQTVEGPCYIVTQSTLNEISFVDLGGDRNTSARIAAQQPKPTLEQEIKTMPETPNPQEPKPETPPTPAPPPADPPAEPDPAEPNTVGSVVEAARRERLRQSKIAELVASALDQPGTDIELLEGLAKEATRNRWTVEQTELEILRASRPVDPTLQDARQRVKSRDVLEAGLALGAGLAEPEKHYNEQTLHAAQKEWRNGLTLGEALMLVASANGKHNLSVRNVKSLLEGAFPREVKAAGFSTSDISGILSNVSNKFLLQGFMSVEQTWREISTVRPVSDFKQVTSYRLTGGFEFEKVGPSGELTHGAAGEESFTNQADTYGRMFAITRTQIINDDMDALSAIPRRIGRGGALKFNNVFWTEFNDNSTFFTAARGNYDSGADTTLTIDVLTEADILFRLLEDADGTPVGVEPRILLVPTASRILARQLTASAELRHDTDADGDALVFATKNPHAGMYRPVSSVYLQSTALGGSSTAWYLLADPADLPVIESVFLNGQQQPTVESADADFNTLGIQMRGYFDFGVSKQDYRAGVKEAGA